MDDFTDNVLECSRDLNTRTVSRIIKHAEKIMTASLNHSEIDELISCVLIKPVNLLALIAEHRTQDSWAKVIGDLFDFIASLLAKYDDHMYCFMESIVKMCAWGNYSAVVRKKAMLCLLALSRCHSSAEHLADILTPLLDMLRRNDELITCRIPLAQLVGSICEHHPELIKEHITVWRSYCIILETNKTPDTLVRAVLAGVRGLFRNFGKELPTADLQMFGAKLVGYVNVGDANVESESLKLLTHYAHLFPEVFAERSRRDALWRSLEGKTGPSKTEATHALVAVYRAVGVIAGSGGVAVDDIIYPELWERSLKHPKTSSVFLRAAWALADVCRSKLSPSVVDRLRRHTAQVVSELEFALECKLDCLRDQGQGYEYDYDLVNLMEKAAWCCGREDSSSDALLRYLIRLQGRCPAARRDELLVFPILNAVSLTRGIVSFLVSESCQPVSLTDPPTVNIDKYASLWSAMLDPTRDSDTAFANTIVTDDGSGNATGTIVTEKRKRVFDAFVDCVLCVLGVYLEKGELSEEETKDKLSSLFHLSSRIFSMEYVEDWLFDPMELLLTATLDTSVASPSDGLVATLATLVQVADKLCMVDEGSLSSEIIERTDTFYKALHPAGCKDELTLVSMCRALVLAPAWLKCRTADLQIALQIIFSGKGIEPTLLRQALQRLTVLAAQRSAYGTDDWLRAINARLRTLAEQCGGDRVTRRLMYKYLAKFASSDATSDHVQDANNNNVGADILSLTLPDPARDSFKINLEQLYDISIFNEDSESLRSFLLILCASAAANKTVDLDAPIADVLHKLAKCWSRGEIDTRAELIEQAALWHTSGNTVDLLVTRLARERSPGVRKILCNVLETVLMQNPLSEENRRLLVMLIEKSVEMLNGGEQTSTKAAFDLIESLTPALKENNEAAIKYIPNVLAKILKTQDADFVQIYDLLLKGFEEKIVIYRDDVLKNTARDMARGLFEVETNDFEIYKKVVKKTLNLVKLISNHFNESFFDMTYLDDIDKGNLARLYVLCEMKTVYNWDGRMCRGVVSFRDFRIVRALREFSENIEGDAVVFCTSVYRFLDSFGDYLLEFQYEHTCRILANMVRRQPVKITKMCRHEMLKCFQSFQKRWSGNVPNVMKVTYKKWFENLPLKDITDKMFVCKTTTEHKDAICTLKLTLQCLNFNDIEVVLQSNNVEVIKTWPQIIKNGSAITVMPVGRTKMAYLTDALTVALFFMPRPNIVDVICEDLEFFRKFIKSFGSFILNDGKILFFAKMRDVLKYVVKELVKYVTAEKMSDQINKEVRDLVDKLWPILESTSSIADLHVILTDLSLLDVTLTPESAPGAWLLQTLGKRELELNDRVRLMEVLSVVMKPGVDGKEIFESAIKEYEAILPLALSELSEGSTPRAFRAVLQSVAVMADQRLLNVVVRRAAGDKSAGWWDTRIEKCMEGLASHSSMDVADHLYNLVRGDLNVDSRILLLNRLLVPLLQWSTQSFCERFFSLKLVNILPSMESVPSDPQRTPPAQMSYRLVEYVVAFTLGRVMFEKVSYEALESTNSILYRDIAQKIKGNNGLVKHVCAVAVTLRRKMAHTTQELKHYYRLFHCANYNCLAAALCKRRPSLKMYGCLFDDVWRHIVDCDAVITRWGPLDKQPSSSRKRHTVSVQCDSLSSHNRTLMTLSRSNRRTLFLHTLSENVFQYDMLKDSATEETATAQSILLTDSELNANECSATLSAILCHLVTVSPSNECPEWLDKMITAMTDPNAHWIVRAFLCQVISNCCEYLKCYAEYLRRPMLTVLVHRPAECGFNGLDVAVLNTIFLWSEQMPPTDINEGESKIISEYLSFLIHKLIRDQYTTNYVPKILLGKVESMVKHFHANITLVWETLWKETMIDTKYIEHSIQTWIILAKHKVSIPNLTSLVASSFDFERANTADARPRKMAELYGLSMASCQNATVRSDSLLKFRKCLDKVRATNPPEYVSILYYAQLGDVGVCDEANFKQTVQLTPKLTVHPRSKCYRIISSYLTVSETSEPITDMFETINLTELVSGGDHVEAGLAIAARGIHMMSETLRRRIVLLAVGYCANPIESVRKLSYEVVVKAFQYLLLQDEQPQPSAKKLKSDTLGSRFIDVFKDTDDVYAQSLLNSLSWGLLDASEDVANIVYEGVEKHLCPNDLNVRLSECMLTVLPVVDAAMGQSVFVRMLLEKIRSNDYYRRLKLQDTPLKKDGHRAPVSTSRMSNLLTLGAKFQATFSSPHTLSNRPRSGSAGVPLAQCLSYPDVQVPVDDLLKSFIKLAEKDLEASKHLFLSIFAALLEQDTTGQLKRSTANLISNCRMSPILLEAARMCVQECWNMPGFISSVESLIAATRGTSGESLVLLLYEDLQLYKPHAKDLYTWIQQPGMDIKMEETKPFSIEGALECFERLSNWNELTVSERSRVCHEMSPLWTQHDDFEMQIRAYFDDTAHLSRLLSHGQYGWLARLYETLAGGSDQKDHDAWLKACRAWPSHSFNLRATAEAIDWHEVRDNQRDRTEVIKSLISEYDNLAESALLLMFRSLLTRTIPSSQNSDDTEDRSEDLLRICREQELAWSKMAVDVVLVKPTLECIKRNFAGLYRSETLAWLVQKTRCEFVEAMDRPNARTLRQILANAKKSMACCGESACPESAREMNQQLLSLHACLSETDFNGNSIPRATEYMISICADMLKFGASDTELLQANRCIMIYCDAMLDKCIDDPETQENVTHSMVSSMGKVVGYGCLTDVNSLVALVLHRRLHETNVKIVLGHLERCAPRLDSTIVDFLRRTMLQKRDLLMEYPMLNETLDVCGTRRDVLAKYLTAVRDPRHALVELCGRLADVLRKNDGAAWSSHFNAFDSDVDLSSQRGTAYQLLQPRWRQLQTVANMEPTPEFRAKAKRIIDDVLKQTSAEPKGTLSLRDLCPALADYPDSVNERDGKFMQALLGSDMEIARFDSQVQVAQLNSLRRPLRIKVYLTDGTTRRYLIKSGEDLRSDAACQRLQCYFNAAFAATRYHLLRVKTYEVTPLGSNAGVIEVLEDCVNLRDAIAKKADIYDILRSVRRPADKELIRMSPTAAASLHQQLVSKTPAVALRSAMEAESTCVEHFVRMKQMFLESLAAMTVSHWILGLGDRHLENLMYQTREGWIVAVDWNCVLGQACDQDPPELQPARLTRQILAVNFNRRSVLESRAQHALEALRDTWRPLRAVASIAFHWKPEYDERPFQDKLSRLRRKLSGEVTSFTSTLEELSACSSPDADKYRSLLRAAAGCSLDQKDSYSVEEQVSALLQQCTDSKIMAVSRGGWEPWL